ncbi:hypothetical protein CSUI_003688 [Cystoisospora suis]|uniref:Uncharacterized protein n=1 Tax=Cystoisospora suis TaxID=483139 RepID=A0A2C6KZW9_9APIC|nr:hypothetical protein CSUI_003688 [Cystoisospora suis]
MNKKKKKENNRLNRTAARSIRHLPRKPTAAHLMIVSGVCTPETIMDAHPEKRRETQLSFLWTISCHLEILDLVFVFFVRRNCRKLFSRLCAGILKAFYALVTTGSYTRGNASDGTREGDRVYVHLGPPSLPSVPLRNGPSTH